MEVAPQRKLTKRLVRLEFSEKMSAKAINSINSEYHALLLKSEWSFNFNEYRKNNMKGLLSQVSKARIQVLYLHYCKESTILKQLAPVQFKELKMLYLAGNKIKNCQLLSKIDLPKLQTLILRNNFISSLRPFRKCCFRLKSLDLTENKLNTLDDLWGCLDLSQLEMLTVYTNKELVLTCSFAKGQLNYSKFNKLWINDSPLKVSKEIDLLQSLGVHDLRIIPLPRII